MNETEKTVQESAKPTWEELMRDPEYNTRMQETVRARLGAAKDAGKVLEELEPVLKTMRQELAVEDNAMLPQAMQARDEARKAALRDHARKVWEESGAVQKLYPDFNLTEEMKDPQFVRMTSPEGGMDVRTAYEVLHQRQLAPAAMAYAVRRTEEKLAGALRSGSLRPEENGAAGTGAILKDDPRSLTAAQRADIRRRVKSGEKIVW